MTNLVLQGSYKNNDWETLASIREDESDQCARLLKEFITTFGNGWSFKWSRS